MIGFHVKCEKCGTDRPDVVYYSGEESTHCADCWLIIVTAPPSFNIDAMTKEIEESLTFSGPISTHATKVQPLATKASGTVAVVDEFDDTVTLHFNTGGGGI